MENIKYDIDKVNISDSEIEFLNWFVDKYRDMFNNNDFDRLYSSCAGYNYKDYSKNYSKNFLSFELLTNLFLKCNIDFLTYLKYIYRESFYNCTALESINIPSNIEHISMLAFAECYNLRSVFINEGLESLYSKCFEDCRSLEKLYLPKSLDKIGRAVFLGCDNLSDIYYAGSEEDFKNIDIDRDSNDSFLNATIHFNC